MNGLNDYGIIGVLLLAIIMLIKDVIVPLLKKAGVLSTGNNPVDLSTFYKEFEDFKESQERWNENVEKKLGIWTPNKNRRE